MALTAALTAILMWASLATLTVSLAGVPPLFLTGMSLLIGGALSLPWMKHWSFDGRSLAIGTYGQFTYHVLYILALRSAPSANANLVHYAWPFLIVLMAPLGRRGTRLGWIDLLAALGGMAGVVLATADEVAFSLKWYTGYGFALAAAFVWASYSIAEANNHRASPVDVGPACMLSGLLALAAHAIFEPATSLTSFQWLLMLALGIGPTGGAFYLWSLALRRGDARVIGVLSNATPILSTSVLFISQHRTPSPAILSAAICVTLSCILIFFKSKKRI